MSSIESARNQYVIDRYDDALARFPLADAGHVARKLEAQYNELHRLNRTSCGGDCHPGNCEVAHYCDSGWAEVEAGERWAMENGLLR